MKIEKNYIKLAYEKLPDNVKEIFDSEETAIALMSIGKKYSLHIDQLDQLVQTVHALILGLIPRNNFSVELKKNSGLTEDVVNLISYDLNQQIFSKIREELQNSSSPKQIFEEKMGGVSNVPKQEVEVKTQTEDNKVAGAETKPPRDPYRETIV